MSHSIAKSIFEDLFVNRTALRENAARESILNGDGKYCEHTPALCFCCGMIDGAIWFQSVGWVCLGCEEVRPDLLPPTRELRAAGKPSQDGETAVLSMFRAGYPLPA